MVEGPPYPPANRRKFIELGVCKKGSQVPIDVAKKRESLLGVYLAGLLATCTPAPAPALTAKKAPVVLPGVAVEHEASPSDETLATRHEQPLDFSLLVRDGELHCRCDCRDEKDQRRTSERQDQEYSAKRCAHCRGVRGLP